MRKHSSPPRETTLTGTRRTVVLHSEIQRITCGWLALSREGATESDGGKTICLWAQRRSSGTRRWRRVPWSTVLGAVSCTSSELTSHSERSHRYTYFTLVCPGHSVIRPVFGVILKTRACIELQPTGWQPISKQGRPCFAHLRASTFEWEGRIPAAGNGCLEGTS